MKIRLQPLRLKAPAFIILVVIKIDNQYICFQDLKDYFRSAGEITYANAHSPRTGDGVVEFATRKGMDYALDHKDELELDGKKLKITVRAKITRNKLFSRPYSKLVCF
jgi:arginine/serine-rich splicing factor 4/5/6